MFASSPPPECSQSDGELPQRESEDLDLVDRMRRGDSRAFGEFYDTYAARLAAFAARRTSFDETTLEDVVQSTLVSAMRGLSNFRVDSSLFTWLCQICRNQIADIRRKAARHPKVVSLEQLSASGSNEILGQMTDSRDPLAECDLDSTRAAVRLAVNRLQSDHARILELRFGDDFTVPQIARILKISETAAESRLVRAKKAFRDAWKSPMHGRPDRHALPVEH